MTHNDVPLATFLGTHKTATTLYSASPCSDPVWKKATLTRAPGNTGVLMAFDILSCLVLDDR